MYIIFLYLSVHYSQKETKVYEPEVKEEPVSLEFSRQPRPLEFKPYTMRDYEEKDFDAKVSSKYWTLGGLGPAET